MTFTNFLNRKSLGLKNDGFNSHIKSRLTDLMLVFTTLYNCETNRCDYKNKWILLLGDLIQ